MAVLHQMGHHSENLLHEPHLNYFHGAMLSPVNYEEAGISTQVMSLKERGDFQTYFDPQLYFPKSERGKLPTWSYYPENVDTADISSEEWWRTVTEKVAQVCLQIKCHAACSPAFAPGVFSNDYYTVNLHICDHFVQLLEGSKIHPIQTVIAGLPDLSVKTRALQIASIISRTRTDTIYLVLFGNTSPRRELSNSEEIKGAMQLISALERSGLTVIVGFSSSDAVLWKAAGASMCATGKYFNLRRFTKSRFEEPSEGGGQLPYWFEESLLAFLRESDIIRIRDVDAISASSMQNPFGMAILEALDAQPIEPWLGLSWRQYMYGIADLERRIESGEVDVNSLLKNAEQAWINLENRSVLMEERHNNGEWLRAWRRGLIEYRNH